MGDRSVAEALKLVLADSYALYLKTQNYHWNVEGPHFRSIHKLLEEHYQDLSVAIDDIAELIRSLGEKAPGTWKAYEKVTKIENGDENADARTMLTHLKEDQEHIVATLQNGVEIAQKEGDEVVVGMLTDRMGVHRKNHWMLSSMLK